MVRGLVGGLVSGMTGGVVASPDVRERIVNGGFASGASWTIEAGGWTIGGGQATNVSPATLLSQQTGALPTGNARMRFTGNNEVGAIIRVVAIDVGGSQIDTLMQVDPAGPISVDQTVTVPGSTTGIAFVETDGIPGSTIDNVSLIC